MRQDSPLMVLGSGPAACAAAIVMCRRGQVVTLANAGNRAVATRIDAVPLQTLAALIELGLHPAELGISGTSNTMLSAWERADPTLKLTAPRVHIERQLLDLALAALVLRTKGLTVDPDASLHDFERVLDATGRRAGTAVRVHRAAPGWIARVRLFEGRFSQLQTALRVAVLPTGYAYRLGTADRMSLGIVTASSDERWGTGCWTDLLGRAGAGWILDGLGEHQDFTQARGGACSLQWAERGAAELIGDAAFAPDILAGQGLSRAITAGLSVGQAPVGPGEAIRIHCSKLRQMIERSRWRAAAEWRDYDRSVTTIAAQAAAIFELSPAMTAATSPISTHDRAMKEFASN